ncbi:hypothetical protein [Flavobacterium branchiophilum]|uniref:Lipoprotein n=1 Tax=Flavobacterium branchiophilum TaxID=55197 RepID=A0A2H3KA07_9FLAO|nr:hypothetical protein [Flavobacterium branchiophilum]PDS23182.1 hypothetical protein B0A77_11405 [Flavobacterium branchiophilum]
MKTKLILLLSFFGITSISCSKEEKAISKPINYVVILDLSDRILANNQLEKDAFLIETFFKKFQQKSMQNLILNSKNRFSVKIIPQKNSTLDTDYFENKLQLYLDEISVKDKKTKMQELSNSISKELQKLKKEALYSNKSSAYFGVDIWSFLHDNGAKLSKPNYENTFLMLTDGYFDFENQNHVIQDKNLYTSTQFFKELEGTNWKKIASEKQYGILPINLDPKTNWIIAGISSKNENDILQNEKITYFWNKWLVESKVKNSCFVLNSSKTDMQSKLQAEINKFH